MAANLSVRVRVTKTSELVGVLRRFKKAVQARVLRTAMTKRSRIIAKAVKQMAPKGPSGMLRKSIGFRVVTYQSGTVVGIVGARRGFRKVLTFTYKVGDRTVSVQRPFDPRFYLHLVLGGRRAVIAGSRSSKKGASATGKKALAGPVGRKLVFFGRRSPAARANNFLRRAARASMAEGVRVYEQAIREGIEKEIAKLRAKAA